jgi:hypothetical protein
MNNNKEENTSSILIPFDKQIKSFDKLSSRPCKNCKEKFSIKAKFSKYCDPCLNKFEKEKNDIQTLNKQIASRVCQKCSKRFIVGKYASNVCEPCDNNTIQIKPKKVNNSINEYKKNANVGVRWGCEFVVQKNKSKEMNPILLIEGKYYIIQKDGKTNCIGNRIMPGFYVTKSYQYVLSSDQRITLQSILSSS